MEHNVDENIQMEEFSDEPDIVWTGIGKKIPVVIFYASLLESELKERFLPSGSFRLTYKTGKTDCKIVRSILQAHGFMEVHPGSSYFNLYWTGSHVKPYDLRCYGEYQKVNHFPRSYEITRKDRLGKNIQRMQQTKGFKSFNFIPKTYVIPEEFHQFVVTFTKEQGVWIVKPIASSRGRGIFLVNHPSQIPTEDPMVVSRYVDNPLCIDGFKFDVRLYVAVTSYYPLRIFLYEEGLTRFATVRYNGTGRNLHNQRMHLTNYSINKKSMEYVRCEDPTIEDYGNKWSMSAMLRYLEEEGKDVATLVSRVEDVIIKTIISGELPIAGACKAFMSQRTNCFEIYGFDILIDKNLYPWLLEVNLSPSLACDAPLDFRIKSNLVADLFSLVGIVVQDPYSGEVKRRQKDSVAECKQRVKPFLSSSTDVSKLNYTAESMHAVRETKEEFARRGKFVRIFPRVDTWDLYGGYLEHKAVNYTLHCQLFPDRVRSRTMSAPKERIRSSQSREQVSLPEVNIAALQKRVDQYKRVLTTKQKQQEAIPLQAVISKRPSYTGMEGVTAATVHRPVISSSEKRAGTVAAENDQAKIDSEVISQSVVKRPLVSEPCDRINPEMLSKIQARHVFAAYLEHVQRRLIKETSYTDVKEKGKFSNESDQADIDLIVKFLKKAASNLRGSFQVIEPSLAIPVRDRCRILAKQLAEFITLYRKETVQYEHREKMYGVYVMKDTKQEGVSDDQFCLFLKQTNESVLEKTLMMYTKANKATSGFLSGTYPTASYENESESASVPGSVHSSCTSLLSSDASRHITGKSSDSDSECLSDPPPLKSTQFQSKKLCRTLSADPCKKSTLKEHKTNSGRRYLRSQTVLDRPTSAPSSKLAMQSSGTKERSQELHSAQKQSKPECRPALGKQISRDTISVALTRLVKKQNARKYAATTATKVPLYSKILEPQSLQPVGTPARQSEKQTEEVTMLASPFRAKKITSCLDTVSTPHLRRQPEIVQVQSVSDVDSIKEIKPLPSTSDQQLRLRAHARAVAHQYLVQKKKSICVKSQPPIYTMPASTRNISHGSHKW